MEAEQIVWTRRASIQFENAQLHISEEAPFAANAFIDRVLEMVDELLRYPQIGRMIPEYENPRFRERVFGHYRLMYTFEDSVVRILALFHDAQELPGKL